jgi:hypothetical protein
MKKYLILYTWSATAAQRAARPTPEQGKAVMEAWMAWGKKNGPAIVDFGNPVTYLMQEPAGSPLGPAKVGGYSILQAESQAALEELFKGHPHFMSPGATIEVHEFLPMPGM